ncbi:MAG: glutamate-cysteine ligase family protein [Peptococcaceae bacterium]
MLKERIVACLKKNEVIHEEFQIGVSFGHFLVNREDLKAVPFDGETGIESLLEYLTRSDWEGLYEEDALIGVQKDNTTVLVQAGGQIEVQIAKTDSLKVIDKAYLDFLQSLGSELEARNQLLLSIGYQPVSKAEEIETVPMVKAQLLTEALKDDKAALQTLKAAAKTVVTLDYAHSDDMEKKYRVLYTLAPVFAALLDNVPVVDGADYDQFAAGIALDDAMQTALSKVENVISGHSFKYAQYANIVASAPAIAVEEGQSIKATDLTNEEVYDNRDVSDDAVAGVLDMMMPEIKLTASGMELHFVDALPYPLNMAYVALIKGLMYNADNLNALSEFVTNLSKELQDGLRASVIAEGMEAKVNEGTVREVAKDLYFMATPMLPENEQHYTQPLDAIIFKNICPKNITKRQLTAMQGK